jgi:TetR/AcrR family transcriptional regulator, transcriptional repressor of bet genes
MPRVVDHAARRSQIVLALWGVIHARGLDGVSFRAVAEEAGISIGRIQHYFDSKGALIREGCVQMIAAARDQHRERSEQAGPRQALWHLASSPIPTSQAQRLGTAVWYAYLAKSASDPGLRGITAEAVETGRAEAVELLRAVRAEAGEAVAEVRLEREALALLSMGDGLAQRVAVGPLDGESALATLAEEFERHGLPAADGPAPQGRSAD